MNFDCVLGHHTNPMTCGIAKFNFVLGKKLGVPFLNIFSPEAARLTRPLVSIKISEFNGAEVIRFSAWLDELRSEPCLFLHAYSDTPLERRMVSRAPMVFCGNEELHRQLSELSPRTVPLWCPGANMQPVLFKPTEISVLSFGMAHKVRADKYIKLRALLEETGMTYSMYLSTALHEGTSFDDSFNEAFEELKDIFGDRIYFLGYLSDQAVYNYLRQTTYFAAFFDGGVRANNTSVNAALQSASVVITNLDDSSPRPFAHMKNVIDINRCQRLPTDPDELRVIGIEGKRLGLGELGWEALIDRISSAM